MVLRCLVRGIRVSACLAALSFVGPARAWAGPVAQQAPTAQQTRRLVDDLIKRVATGDADARNKASAQLLTQGPRIAPFLRELLSQPQTAEANAARQTLIQLADKPGKPVRGLTLSAVFVGPPPRKGETVPLWITLTNASDKDIRIYPVGWKLGAAPADSDKRLFQEYWGLVKSELTLGARDATLGITLRPNQQFGCLMDAEPAAPANAPARIAAHLRIGYEKETAAADQDGDDKKVSLLLDELISAPLIVPYRTETAADMDLRKLVDDWLKADKKKEAEEQLLKAPQALEALRLGLRRADLKERWPVFSLLCKRPPNDVADDVVDFLARLGPYELPSLPDAAHSARGRFLRPLPERERLVLSCRIAWARPYDWHTADLLARDGLAASYDPSDLAACARMLSLIPQDELDARTGAFLAWQHFAHQDPKLHDPKRALELAKSAAKKAPDLLAISFVLAMIEGKKDEAVVIAGRAATASERNEIAWILATAGRTDAQDNDLAIQLAKKAVESVDNFANLDTLACTYATAGQYADAAATMEKAWDALPAAVVSEYECFTRRLARFWAIANTDEKTRAAAPNKIGGDKARNVLLDKLDKAKGDTGRDFYLRKGIVEVLKDCYASDPAVQKALAAEANRTPDENDRTPPPNRRSF